MPILSYEKSRLNYKVIKDNGYQLLIKRYTFDQLIQLTGYASPRILMSSAELVFYAETLNRTFVYLTNNVEISGLSKLLCFTNIVGRWNFFKWIKQHLKPNPLGNNGECCNASKYLLP